MRALNNWYRTWANARGITHLTLTETDAIRILGMIVKPDNGDAGPAGSNPVPIDSNHWTICKPADRTHDTYVFVRKFIESHVERPKTAAEEELAALNAKVDQLVTALTERGETSNAEEAGVSPEAIIRLAQRINVEIDDFDQALLELERAVGISIEVAEEGRRSSNIGDFIDVVLSRIAEKSANGQFEEAAIEADTAFVQWERDEAERRDAAVAGGGKLLDAGLRQDILLRDAVSAAKHIERRVALEHPEDRDARFAAMRKRQTKWYSSGRNKGLNFDLQVSIEVARLLLASASGPDETSMARMDLGVALRTLGERESDTARLDEAVEVFRAALHENTAYRAALQERTRGHVPLQWAMTQNNLGTALQKLGELEGNTARFEQAIETYRAALQERTRERVPLDWATTQHNLGIALHSLGAREEGTVRLEQAIEAYRAALLERTRERAPYFHDRTQQNLAVSVRLLERRTKQTTT